MDIKELEDLRNRLKVSNIGTNILLVGAGIGVAGASVATLYCLPIAAIYLGLAGVYGLEYIRCQGHGDLECMVEGLKNGGIFAMKGLVSAGSAIGFGLYGAHLNAKKEKRKAVDAVFSEKLQELKDPCPQKEYVYNPETNSFQEWKEYITKASNEHNATLCKELLDKYPGTLGTKEIEDLANSLKVSNVLLAIVGIGALVASGATAYFLFEATDNLLFAKELAYDYINTPRRRLEPVTQQLKISGSFAITGLATACPAIDLGLYAAHLAAKKENHKPIDTILTDKIKQLKELEKQT